MGSPGVLCNKGVLLCNYASTALRKFQYDT